MNIQKLAHKKSYFFWSTANYDKLSDSAIVEGILEYGDFKDIRELIKIMGEKKVSEIFFRQIKGERCNYDKKTINYFKMYFKQHA